MGLRSERVVLSLGDDGFTSGMARAAAATALLDQSLKDVRRSSSGANRNMTNLNGSMGAVGTSSSTASRGVRDLNASVGDLNRSTTGANRGVKNLNGNDGIPAIGRNANEAAGGMRLLAEAAAILGPGLVPITASAVPVLAGLTAEMTAAAIGAGVLVLAVKGVGKALAAVDKYELTPTAANLEKVRLEFQKMGPAGSEFVLYLNSIEPALKSLQTTAREGFFPGATDGIELMMKQLPDVRRVIGTVANALGRMASDAGAGLTGSGFSDFFHYIQTDAAPTLVQFGQTIGNFAEGLGAMIAAFAPMSRGFSAGLLDMSASFATWAHGLSESSSFQDFIDYVRTSGPQVLDTLGSLVNMLVQVGEAVAPLGAASLGIIKGFADAIAAIADSDIGTPLYAGLAAMLLLTRATALWGTASTSAAGQAAAGQARALAGIRTLRSDYTSLRTQMARVPAPTAGFANFIGPLTRQNDALVKQQAAMIRQRQALAATGAAFGKTAALVGGFALATSGASQSMGVTNTVTLGLMGTMLGGYGPALGLAAGYALDFAKSNNDAEQAVRNLNDVVAHGTSLEQFSSAISDAQATAEAFSSSVSSPDFFGQLGKGLSPGGLANNIDVLFGGYATSTGGQLDAAKLKAEQTAGDLQLALNIMAQSMGEVGKSGVASMGQLQTALQGAGPAMQALGITTQDLIKAVQDGSILSMVDKMHAWQTAADSTAGRTKALGTSITDLGNEALSTAASATQMSEALDALLSPTLDAEAATDAWRASLQTLRSELNDAAGFDGFGKNAMKNRELTRTYVTDSKARLTALAGLATTTEGDMANAVAKTRSEFIKSGVAAGFSRKEIVKRANDMGLTPKLVSTVFRAAGISKTDLEVRSLQKSLHGLPKDVQTAIRAKGIPLTMGQVNALVKKYDLTEKQRTALIKLKDQATGNINGVQKLLKRWADSKASAKVDANSKPAMISLSKSNSELKAWNASRGSSTVDADKAPAESAIGAADARLKFWTQQHGMATVDADPGPAFAGVSSAQGAINSLQGKTVTLTTIHRDIRQGVSAASSAQGLGYAAGGYTGDGGKHEVAGLVHRGEFVVDAARTARDRAALESRYGRIPGYAGGGYVRRITRDGDGPDVARDPHSLAAGLAALKDRLRDVNKALRQSTASVEEEKNQRDKMVSRLDALTSKRDEFGSGVASGLRKDIFTVPEASSDVWARGAGDMGLTKGGVNRSLREQTHAAKHFTNLIRKLKDKGLDGAALAELISTGDVERAELYARLDRKDLGTYERLYGQRERALSQVASRGGNAVYGEQVAEQAHEARKQTHELQQQTKAAHRVEDRVHAVEKAIKHMEARQSREHKKNSDDNAHKVAGGVNHAAGSAKRRTRG